MLLALGRELSSSREVSTAMRFLFCLAILSCCAPAQIERVQTTRDVEARATRPVVQAEVPAVAIEVEPDPCEGRVAGLHVLVPEVVVQDCVQMCWVPIPYEVLNCSEHSERIDHVEIRRLDSAESEARLTHEFAQKHLDARESFSRSYNSRYSGGYQITLFHDGEPIHARFTIRNPSREAAMLACEACNGDWGPRGMLSLVGCNCRTRDVGQRCISSADCEGACIYERSVRITDPPPDQPECTSWVMEGTCSARTSNFGCHAHLSEPHYACEREMRAPYVCGD